MLLDDVWPRAQRLVDSYLSACVLGQDVSPQALLVAVDIQNIADLFYANLSEWAPAGVLVKEPWPVVAPPWPIAWYEWARSGSGGRWAKEGALLRALAGDGTWTCAQWSAWFLDVVGEQMRGHRVGPSMNQSTPPDSIPEWVVIGQGYARGRSGPTFAPQAFAWMAADDGALLWSESVIPAEWGDRGDLWFMGPCLLATAFVHAANVSTRARPAPEAALQRARQRRGLRPLFRFHWLDVQPMVRTLRDTQRANPGASLPTALHMCRGHFKDYRQGVGLFGRRKGVFWWDATVRGHLAAGIVDKGYRVGRRLR